MRETPFGPDNHNRMLARVAMFAGQFTGEGITEDRFMPGIRYEKPLG